ncbi:gluconolactonase [Tamilnaduibacter salinus]|uniref:Gluconolactonase n=1 Tax=Tamilnaduibacter salinus TaxID=1484056 RepID=A0A2A2I087_9GAMM|nr:SMP-30/gluconolactonase/LRE family protein [Tamilnaduibacter salinus]PAV25431.1 gluconolactonase [Tamilnaduibacter salinus]
MRWIFGLCVVVFMVLGGFLLTPSPVDSRAWTPPVAPGLDGKLAPNERLRLAELLAKGQVTGPEDVDVDQAGRIHAGLSDGRIVRIWPDGKVERWVDTGGRPLGLDFDRRGNLIVADASRGLMSIDPGGNTRVLAREAEGLPFRFADDVDVAPDGRIYFTDATSEFSQRDYRLDLLETRPHGRLLRYDPATGRTDVLMHNLYFANGVAVAPAGDYLLVNETWRYRVLKYHLKGPKAGTAEVLVENLPGFPDGVSVDREGRFWVALATTRNRMVDAVHPYPWIKEQIAKLPDSLKPAPRDYGLVLAMNGDGEILTSLHDTDGRHLKEITSVEPHLDKLYFGTLHGDRIGRLSMSIIPDLSAGDDDD